MQMEGRRRLEGLPARVHGMADAFKQVSANNKGLQFIFFGINVESLFFYSIFHSFDTFYLHYSILLRPCVLRLNSIRGREKVTMGGALLNIQWAELVNLCVTFQTFKLKITARLASRAIIALKCIDPTRGWCKVFMGGRTAEHAASCAGQLRRPHSLWSGIGLPIYTVIFTYYRL